MAKIILDGGVVIEGTVEELMAIQAECEKKAQEGDQVNAQPSRLHVGDTVKVSIPEGQRPAYGWGNVKNGDIGKVNAVFINSVTVEFPAHNSWTARLTELVKVAEDGYVRVTDRKPKAGDYVKFAELTEDFEDCFSLGKYYEITEIDDWEDPQIIGDEGNSYDTAGDDFEVYELVGTKLEAKSEYSVGSLVKVLRNQHGHDAVIGDIVKIVKIDEDDTELPFRGEVNSQNVGWFAHSEIEPVAEAETLKEENTALRVGDYAKVINYRLRNGNIVEITETDRQSDLGFTFRAKGVIDAYYDVFSPNQLVKATDTEVAKAIAPKFNVGDYVKIVKSTRGLEGTIAKIIGTDSIIHDYEIVHIPKLEGRYGANADMLVKATEEEVAEAKLAEQFAKLGRKPNEFKKGDVVRVIKESSGHEVGTIGEVVAVDSTERPQVMALYNDGRVLDLWSYAELIAPVESRVDRQ